MKSKISRRTHLALLTALMLIALPQSVVAYHCLELDKDHSFLSQLDGLLTATLTVASVEKDLPATDVEPIEYELIVRDRALDCSTSHLTELRQISEPRLSEKIDKLHVVVLRARKVVGEQVSRLHQYAKKPGNAGPKVVPEGDLQRIVGQPQVELRQAVEVAHELVEMARKALQSSTDPPSADVLRSLRTTSEVACHWSQAAASPTARPVSRELCGLRSEIRNVLTGPSPKPNN